jgi:hypothetical protein
LSASRKLERRRHDEGAQQRGPFTDGARDAQDVAEEIVDGQWPAIGEYPLGVVPHTLIRIARARRRAAARDAAADSDDRCRRSRRHDESALIPDQDDVAAEMS